MATIINILSHLDDGEAMDEPSSKKKRVEIKVSLATKISFYLMYAPGNPVTLLLVMGAELFCNRKSLEFS